jgi:hypothetical protein
VLSAEYLAGFFDGEGWVSATSQRQSVVAGVCNCNLEIIKEIQVQFPGACFNIRPGSETYRPAYRLQWTSGSCLPFLYFIVEHLRIKKKAVELAIELARICPAKNTKRSNLRLAERRALGEQIHLLVKRGA